MGRRAGETTCFTFSISFTLVLHILLSVSALGSPPPPPFHILHITLYYCTQIASHTLSQVGEEAKAWHTRKKQDDVLFGRHMIRLPEEISSVL